MEARAGRILRSTFCAERAKALCQCAMQYDYCVVGNGLLGAAVALELAHPHRKVCVVDADYGDEQTYFSSHEDDSRLIRMFHGDPYWERLAVRNMEKLNELMHATSIPIFSVLPVLYRFGSKLIPCSEVIGARTNFAIAAGRNEFQYEDRLGGIVNPKWYVTAMNKQATRKGAVILHTPVRRIERKSGRFHVALMEDEIVAARVVDARGIYSERMRYESVCARGKILIFTATQKEGSMYGFVDADNGSDAFRDVFGLCNHKADASAVISKFGFSEHKPVDLPSFDSIVRWFRKDYLDYPYIGEAKRWIADFHGKRDIAMRARPWGYTETPNGRPFIAEEDGLLTIAGCNSMTAKCCQALAEEVLCIEGFLQ